MIQEEMAKIKEAFAIMASYYGKTQYSDAALRMIGADLGDLSFQSVMTAIAKYKNDPKNNRPPLPAQIREIINPHTAEKDDARYLAAKIIGCIARYGYTWSHGYYLGGDIKFGANGKLFDNFQEAMRYELGEAGSHVINLIGGWACLCERDRNESTGTLQAQLRDLCEATLIKAKNETLNQPLGLNGSDVKKLNQAPVPENIRALLPKKENLE